MHLRLGSSVLAVGLCAAPGVQAQEEAPAQTVTVHARRPAETASTLVVRHRDFELRPLTSVADILRVTPGLVVVQHSGGGKANQYFLRGFDADHGTDVAFSVDGVPINLVSHAHGQGYSDTNFLIPEVIERVEITKGPYFASQGDFATAGAVNLVTRDAFEHSSVGFGAGGSPGHGLPGYRGLFIASPKLDGMPRLHATLAADVGRENGPFDHAQGWDRYKLWNKVTYAISPRSRVTVSEASYQGAWSGSGQIPARAVEEGLVTRFGALDPSEGGWSSRHQVAIAYSLRPSDDAELRALAFVGTYQLRLFSNFTFATRDPVHGDAIEQIDRRIFLGGESSYRVTQHAGAVRFDTTVGSNLRSDAIRGGLGDVESRRVLETRRDDAVHETSVGAYLTEEVSPVSWLRMSGGGRADFFAFAVDQELAAPPSGAPSAGVRGASQLSPKLGLVVTPIDREQTTLDLYASYGHGFHSNDARGVFATPAVTPLARAIGSEVGARVRLLRRWDLALALWQLDLDSEIVWSGDDGTTEASHPTHRYGAELETRFAVAPWLVADGSVTVARSYFSVDGANGGGLALAPRQTWSGGLSARHPSGVRAGLRFFGIADRPATDDGALVAPGFTQVDLHLGYRHRRFDIAFDVENLLNGAFRSAEFATVSRLPGEPAIGAPVPAGFACGAEGRVIRDARGRFGGCEDIHFTPAYPLTARIMTTVFLD